jgi:penicillin-binding protein 2
MDRSRIVLVLGLVLLPLMGLEARLVQLQLADSTRFTGDLQTRHRSVQLASPARGRILDGKGRVLAEDRRSFDCYLVLEEYEKNPGPLAPLLGLAPGELRDEIERIYEKIEKQVLRRPAAERRLLYRRERRTPYLLRRDIPFEAALTLETGPQNYPGAVVRESLKRTYPWTTDSYRRTYPQSIPGSHALGYLRRITANESEFRSLLQDGTLYEGFEELIGQDGIAQLYRRGVFHDQLIGCTGLEREYDSLLRGKPGLLILEREPGTSDKRVIELKPAEPGQDVELTLDIEVQAQVEEILAGTCNAAAVVMDPHTGAVIALASNRGFDPNAFTPPGNAAAVREAFADKDGRPLVSRAFAGHYQLGSIFKVVTSAAGLEEKKVRPEELLPCRGKFIENSRFFACHIWNNYRMMHGELALSEALERSCNCYYYEVGRRVGLAEVVRWASTLGFGAPTGLDLPGEAAGTLPRQQRQENDVLSLAIGQHELMVSPLQVAVMLSAVANGGLRVTPHLKRGESHPPVPTGLTPRSIEVIRQGLHAVVQSPHGTAHSSGLREFDAAGKTSTAQGGGNRNHAWFGGYAPFDKPRATVVVFIEFGGHGGDAAAPLAAKILAAIRKADGPRAAAPKEGPGVTSRGSRP